MKALSLWQPWASAMATGAKTIETRGWSTNYRGELAIHAAKRRLLGELRRQSSSWIWCGALGLEMGAADLENRLPFGAVVAVVTMQECKRTEDVTCGEIDVRRYRRPPPTDPMGWYSWTERTMGNYGPGRFAWLTTDLRRLAEPVPCTGRQGLFNLPPDVERAVREQLESERQQTGLPTRNSKGASKGRQVRETHEVVAGRSDRARATWWDTEPRLVRVVHGVADRVDRIRALGNGQVPAVVEGAWKTLSFRSMSLRRGLR
jgi:hypothetical protein